MVLRLSECQICFLVQFWREWLIFLILWGLIGKVFVFKFFLVSLVFCLFLLLLWPYGGHCQYRLWLWPHSFALSSGLKTVWSQFGFWSHLLELPMSSICLLLWRRVSLLLLGCFIQQNPAVFPLSHFCYLFQRVLCISFCHLCSSLQFWRWSRPLLCGGCKLSCLWLFLVHKTVLLFRCHSSMLGHRLVWFVVMFFRVI